MSLKTSFLEPDHTTSFASHCTWETNVMPNTHGHKADTRLNIGHPKAGIEVSGLIK
jgi:hypothetical protein